MVEAVNQHQTQRGVQLERVLVVGLGGGALCTYLHKTFPHILVEGVDIDPCMVQLASQYFGFTADSHLRAHISDGIQFIKDVAASGNSIVSSFITIQSIRRIWMGFFSDYTKPDSIFFLVFY